MAPMERTQISLTTEQARRLRGLARRRGSSMAALIRAAVDRVYPEAEPTAEAAWERAIASIGGFHSKKRDVSEQHDAYLAEALAD
jgi:hypothetical protein